MISHGTTKFLLEIKESLLIKCDEPELNKNIVSATLFLFDTPAGNYMFKVNNRNTKARC